MLKRVGCGSSYLIYRIHFVEASTCLYNFFVFLKWNDNVAFCKKDLCNTNGARVEPEGKTLKNERRAIKMPVLNTRRNHQTGGLSDRTSIRSRNLLADESVVASAPAEVQKLRKDKSVSFSDFVIRSTPYDYPRIGKVPATRYRSTIADMQVRVKNDKKILDVFYDLEDVYGQKYYIKQSYPEGSQPFQNLASALAAAGVPDGSTVDKAIGTVEILEVDYKTADSDFGYIGERRPYVAPPNTQDEDDDYLDNDDD